MASVYDLKPAFQRLLRPTVAGLVRAGVTPNQITLAALIGSVAVGAILWGAPSHPRLLLLLPAWLLVRMALNALDGMAARDHGMMSRRGAALNEVGDVVSDLAIYLPLSQWYPDLLWPVVAFCLGAVLTEFCGVLGPALGDGRRYEGPMGKSDRALWIGLLSLITAFVPGLLAWWSWVFWVVAALTVLTCWNRVAAALREPSPSRSS